MAFDPIHALVGQAAEKFPEHVAVQTPQGDLTYADLAARSDLLATRLRAAGATPGALVPVLTTDRREFAVAVLGILKTGAVFVPFDLAGPGLRLRDTLSGTAAEFVVTGTGEAGRVAELLDSAVPQAGRFVVDLAAPAAAEPLADPHVPDADDPAYIFFTSGSTGTPKAIAGRMRGIDHYIRWESELLGVEPGWRVSQFASVAFDAVLRDLFLPLTTGGTAVVPPPGLLLDGAELGRWIDAQKLDLVHCVPSVFRGLATTAESADSPGFASLRAVLTAGEPLAAADAGRWFARHGERVTLVNLYGPSETTMTKTFHVVTPADAERELIPAGQAMPGARIAVLDGRGKPSPQGTVGEIYIRTPFMSLGYYLRPDATLAAFVPNPLGDDPDDIVYRTGDFGRILADGSLEFIGRKDHQIKIGGVRVELGEVEHLVRAHPAVREAAVVPVKDAAGEVANLCAFVELAEAVEPEALAAYLGGRLPDIAVPRVFVPLDRMPRTISGKVDRRALPAPILPQQASATRYVAPRTPTETALIRIWTELLPVEEPGIRHDFFESGGHSLLVMRLLSLIGAEFGVEIPLQDFLAGPTVEALAERVETAILTGGDSLDDLLDSLDDLDDAEAERLLQGGSA
ncbi:amino acid adenylation domain-containing protein [Streptomyces sp. NPDC058612]|uniref:non-ribosomal peptide synthetase n=1 Tax=Streptomyces sp. NPDC058612 TaxID=3346555 RepID=UPI00364E1BD6